ncbi:MAG: family 16 glycoside hydrolase [Ginsengibacter sp.]
MNTVAGNEQPFLPIGTGTGNTGFCLRTVNNESSNDEWTTIDLVCFEGKSLHIVNGKVVMVLANSRYFENGKFFPLTKGKIQLQSEGAEVFYKDIQIQNISKLPDEFEKYFR